MTLYSNADMIDKVDMKGDKVVPQPTQPLDIIVHTRVRTSIEPQDEPDKKAEDVLALARQSCEGLTKEELAAMASAKLRSENFFQCLY